MQIAPPHPQNTVEPVQSIGHWEVEIPTANFARGNQFSWTPYKPRAPFRTLEQSKKKDIITYVSNDAWHTTRRGNAWSSQKPFYEVAEYPQEQLYVNGTPIWREIEEFRDFKKWNPLFWIGVVLALKSLIII